MTTTPVSAAGSGLPETKAGYYRLIDGRGGSAIYWCEPDDFGDVAILETDEIDLARRKPVLLASPQWFADLLVEKIETDPTKATRARRKPSRWERTLAALDKRGATYAGLDGHPGWYVIEWYEPGYPTPDGGPWRQVYRPGMPRQKGMLRAVARRAKGAVTS